VFLKDTFACDESMYLKIKSELLDKKAEK